MAKRSCVGRIIVAAVAASLATTVGHGTVESEAPAMSVLRQGELARVIAAYQTLPRSTDRTRFDVGALAAALGGDPLKAFEFVRDVIADEVYPGVLRGAAGTLQAGAGNDLDKSLLLAALLPAATPVRYARCALTPEETARRVATMFAPGRAARAEADLGPALADALVAAGMSAARSAEIAAARQRSQRWLGAAVMATARADLEILRAALSKAGIAPLASGPDPALFRDAREHYWLQVDLDGAWRDFDAGIPGGAPGSTRCAAAETADRLPDAAYQTLTLSLRNEYVDGQALRSETVLRHRVRVSDVTGTVLAVVNVGLPEGGDLLNSARLDRFLPFVRMPAEVVAGSEFSVAGGGTSATDATLDALGGGSEPPVLAAQWLDVVIEAPGRQVAVSRALVDLVDPAERERGVVVRRPEVGTAVLALAQNTAVAVTAGVLDPAAAIDAAFRDLDPAAAGLAFDRAADAGTEDEDVQAARAASDDALLAATALAYATHSERAVAALDAAAGGHVRLIRDQPLLTIATLGLRRRADAQLVSEFAIDFRHARARAVPESPAHAETAFWANVLCGLADGAIERHLPAVGVRAPDAKASKSFDTSRAFALAAAQGIGVVAEAGPSAPRLRAALAAGGGLAMARDVTPGTAVVMPAQPVQTDGERRLAAWVVDLGSGHLLPLLDNGLRGQNTVEGRLVRLINFLERQIRRCVASAASVARCRQMFQLWADAANRLRALRGLPGRINVNNGHFTGFSF